MTNEIAVTFIDGDIVNAAKLNAMQQSLAVEGDYTSYTYVWGRNYTGVAAAELWISDVSNTGTVSFTDQNTTALYKKTYSGAESSASYSYVPFLDPDYLDSRRSALGSYFPLVVSGTTLHIYKDGSVLQTLDTSDDNTDCDTHHYAIMSSNGKYLAIVSEPVGSNATLYLMLYEGA